MDFPWPQWVHERKPPGCGAGSGELFIVSTGGEGLSGVKIECARCGAFRTMTGAFAKEALKGIWPTCPGERPWLGPAAGETCGETARCVQRGASNVYFPFVVSSILIPPHSERVRRILDRPEIQVMIDGLPIVDGRIAEQPLVGLAEHHGLDPAAFIEEAALYRQRKGREEEAEPQSETEYRRAEYRAFLGPRPAREERGDFDLKSVPMAGYPSWFRRLVDRVVLLPKLRETRVLRGFTRLVPPASEDDKLGKLSLKHRSWLPAIEVRGEGLFLTLSPDALARWEEDPALSSRIEVLRRRLRNSVLGLGTRLAPDGFDARFIAVHTLAHLLIRQLSFDCGYDCSSLRERLYVGGGAHSMCGLLIYTASGDSEGTLGGLVRQGLPDRFERTLEAAIANARLCSSDPLCLESKGQGAEGLNLAACHACALLPETSCERGNRLLDRAVLIGDAEHPEVGLMEAVGH